MHKKVVIIGAGLTGLTLAFYLKKAGWDILVLEKDKDIGGAMKTFEEDGFIIESGANTGTLATPEAAELFAELTPEVQLEIADSKAKKRLIFKSGKFRELPHNVYTAVTTPLFSFYDKLRVLGEPYRRKATDRYETVAQMTRRRMGKTFLDYAIDPFVSGVYAGDPEKLVFRYALPKMWAFEDRFGSLIKGGIMRSKEMKKDERLRLATREVMSAFGGFGKLINGLAYNVGNNNILCDTSTISIQQATDKWQVAFTTSQKEYVISTDYVITTVNAGALPELLPFLPRTQLMNISNVRYAKMLQISLCFKKWNGPSIKAFGGLVPSKENRKILGVLFLSSFFKGRAPENGALLIAYMGGINHPEMFEWSDSEIKEVVLSELRDMLNYNDLQPDIIKIFRHPSAIPQYERSTGQRLQAVKEVQEQYPGLIVAGNLRDGIGMADRIKQARTIADQLINTNKL